MKLDIVQLLCVVIFTVIGFKLALPISYYFQSDIYSMMPLMWYVQNAPRTIEVGAQFGASSVYLKSLLICTVGGSIVGAFIANVIRKRINKC